MSFNFLSCSFLLLASHAVFANPEVNAENLEVIDIQAEYQPIATVLEYSSARHIIAAMNKDSSILIGDYVNIQFEDNSSCSLKVIERLEARKLVFATTKDCPQENRIRIGMKITKSLIPPNIGEDVKVSEKADSDMAVINEGKRDGDRKLNSINYRPRRSQVSGETLLNGYGAKYTINGEDYEESKGQLWQKLVFGVTDQFALGASFGVQHYGTRKFPGDQSDEKHSGILDPFLFATGEAYHSGKFIVDFNVMLSPKIKERDYDQKDDKGDAGRGGSLLSGEGAVGYYSAAHEHRISFAAERHFKEEQTVNGEEYSEGGEYSAFTLLGKNRFFAKESIGIDFNLGYRYTTDELIVYYTDQSEVLKAHSELLIGTGVYGLINPQFQIFFTVDWSRVLDKMTIEPSDDSDYYVKDYSTALIKLGVSYEF